MKLLSRIEALEKLRPAPNVMFVVRYLPDGSLVPLERGQRYGKHVALFPETPASVEEWFKLFVEPNLKDPKGALQRMEATHRRVREAVAKELAAYNKTR